jgi:hypothetical protein
MRVEAAAGRTWRRPNQRSQSASLRSAVGAGRRSCERAWASKGTLRGAPGLLGQPARRQRLRRARKRRRQRGRRQRRLPRNRQAGARASCSSRKTALSVIVRKRPAPCRTPRGPSNRYPFPSLTWSVRPRRWKNRNPRKVPTCLNRTPTLWFHRDRGDHAITTARNSVAASGLKAARSFRTKSATPKRCSARGLVWTAIGRIVGGAALCLRPRPLPFRHDAPSPSYGGDAPRSLWASADWMRRPR